MANREPTFQQVAMKTKNPHTKLLAEARLDAIAYVRVFRSCVGREGKSWVRKAWAELTRHLQLSDEQANRLWPEYWSAFSAETDRLASRLESDR
jgi:hypothetical protein